MKDKVLLLFLKAMAMGAANVIPGVSGGTIAFITGIYEPFINALKSFDKKAIGLLLSGKWKLFSSHINLPFLIVMGLGIAFSLISVGKALDYLFEQFPIYVWSFFFGLIAISIYSVGKTITKWSPNVIFWFAIGTILALGLAFLKPAEQNEHFTYLLLCGIVAMASMILPGLSGSFVLILMGNYQLIMLKAVPELNTSILLPVGIGAILGFLILARIINYFMNSNQSLMICLQYKHF